MPRHRPEPPRRTVNWLHVAQLERDLYGETYHHVANGCCCDECRAERIAWADHLNAERAAAEAWHTVREHHDPIWILPPPRHTEARL